MRTERARALMNTACGAKTFMVTPAELKELVPQVDLKAAVATRSSALRITSRLRPPGTTASPGHSPRAHHSAVSTSSSTRR